MIGSSLIRRMLALHALAYGTALAGPYDAAPLRTNLGVEPYYKTEEGRTNKRFSDGDLQRYRIYDFYRRQAEYHLKPEQSSARLLPPYPGLDGGRRGHWGATNEKNSSRTVREAGPAFTRMTSREGKGELIYRPGDSPEQGLIVYDTRSAGLRRFLSSARLSTVEHPFGLAVDRFGMSLTVQGSPVWTGADHEWSRDKQPLATWRGYARENNCVVLLWELDGVLTEERAQVIASSDRHVSALQRHWEFGAAIPTPCTLHLPHLASTSDIKAARCSIDQNANDIWVTLSLQDQAVVHRVETRGHIGCHVSADAATLSLQNIHAEDQLRISSWAGRTEDLSAAKTLFKGQPSLNTAIAKRPLPAVQEFAAEITVKGHCNADPEASGSDYEIDDIPVPMVNADRTPMTLSGIAFDDQGTAYISTLVGDVWRVTGLHGDLSKVSWKRFAAGLDLPMGVAIVKGKPCVNVRHHLIRLTDRDQDGEADLYERINRMLLPNNTENGRDLRCDGAGNFLFNTSGGIYQLSADGTQLKQIGTGSRNPLGIGVRADGLTLSDSSEGNGENGTCTIFESDHPENQRSIAKRKRLIYLPRGIDNSPGSRLFLDDDRFGPLGKSILGVSFGAGTWYTLLRDVGTGTPQAMLVPHAGAFGSGACRVAQQPLDGQVFVAGLDGWGDYGINEGCLHRIRYTGKERAHLTAWRAHRNGIWLSFNKPLGALPDAARCFVQQWNYIDSPQTYGSPEYSVKDPGTIGHDRLHVASIVAAAAKNEVFIAITDLLPSMCLQLHLELTDAGGRNIPIDVYATVQQLQADAPWGRPTPPERAASLVVPTLPNNGDTYQKLIEHFDRLAGRETKSRAVTAEVHYRAEELNYAWIHKNLLEPNCLMCHGPGTQHDYSSYEGLMSKVRVHDVRNSMLHGMMQSGSMPPYPLPSISPSMQRAVMEWIQRGAPK